MITENTVQSGNAAVYCGADMVEFDVVRSVDGDFFVFHDGYEKKKFDIHTNMNDMTSSEIHTLRYRLHGDDEDPKTVATVREMIESLPHDALLNVDRSWRFWDTLLPFLDTFDCPERLILKCPPVDGALSVLAQHKVDYPLVPMVRTVKDIELTANSGTNVVGFELLASKNSHPFTKPEFIKELHELGYFVFVNAINLENNKPLFAGWDDAAALRGHPERGWGRLVGLGADVIQTDWPALLAHYLGKPLEYPVYGSDK